MQYIDKAALLLEIDRQKIGYNVDGKHSVEYYITRKIIDIINSLEVKEVDLDLGSSEGDMSVKTIWYKGKIVSQKAQKGE